MTLFYLNFYLIKCLINFFSSLFFIEEKISLEDVLKKINPSRSRLNSADDKVVIYNNDLANYYCVTKNKPQSNSGAIKLRKSSSFDSINKYVNKYETPAIHNKTPNNFNIIDHYNNNATNINTINTINTILPQKPANAFTNTYSPAATTPNSFTSHTNSNSNIYAVTPTTNNNANTKSTRNPPNFKDMLIENQKTIQDINKEALKEFQSLVSSELKKTMSTSSTNQTPVLQTDTQAWVMQQIKNQAN